MNDYGFIITRHVNSIKTNKYWNNSVKLIRTYYPKKKIVIIDDNSNNEFVKPEFNYNNVEIIKTEFPKRGELLPYFYLLKHKFFENAIIIHDSVFIHKRINFDKLCGIDFVPVWHFNNDFENVENTLRIATYLKNNFTIINKLKNKNVIELDHNKWYGCFGVQSYINLKFLEKVENKYNITNLVKAVNCRTDRCSLERILGCIFFSETNKKLSSTSLLGDIMKYQTWGYSYDTYENDIKKRHIPRNVIKVWTGR